ncbi:uncharacterized protein LY79DRAFT_572322 [Colletotrichum navitas]|uniref:BZIP domain-containing protein n=1 Tax=Colletotrichum navitas TaxID=681940 RepID=A0AAD8UW26_9PEZI|nr:uncharacterized protein LY79DRAFT_572322 [Colletotrichum navitas]KAK1566297.1 hypothetical protein LY79DRAFT_572322 [Colletotrichum navitas]
MKNAQRQRDAVLKAFTAPGQAHHVLRRLQNGETLDRIYEHLEMHGPVSPTTSQSLDPLNQFENVSEEASSTPTEMPICSPQTLSHTNSAVSEGPETSRINMAIKNQDSASNCAEDEPDRLIPYLQTPTFSNTTLTNGIYGHPATNRMPEVPFGMFMERNTPLIFPNAYCPNQTYPTDNIGNISWWHSGISGPMQPNYVAPPSTNPDVWPYHQFTGPYVLSQEQDSQSQPISTPRPVPGNSPLTSHSLSQEKPRYSVASSTSTIGESQYPTLPPPKKRKLPTKDHDSIITSRIGNRSESNNFVLEEKIAKNKPSDQEHSSRERERHRRASARNWQKQKQQLAELEAVMEFAESRNRELHREYAEVLRQVMDVKNALMDHAKCNHPEINSWLHSQATKYVLRNGSTIVHGDAQSCFYSIYRETC